MLSQFAAVGDGVAPLSARGNPYLATPAGVKSAAPPPRSVALFFDDVNTSDADLRHARNAALEFLHNGIYPGDQIGLFTASGIQEVPFTGNVNVLAAALKAVRAHPRANSFGLRDACPRITPYQAYQIAVLHFQGAFDAAMSEKAACESAPVDDLTGQNMIGLDPGASEPILAQAQATWDLTRTVSEDTQNEIAAVVAALARQSGRRILLLASGGFLSETLELGQEKIINAALHANVVINALDAKGLYTEDPSRPLSQQPDSGVLPLITFFYEQETQLTAQESEVDGMIQMAQSTGGLFFHNNNDLELGFERLGLEPPVTYELAFAPASLPHDGRFHKLQVKLDPPIKGAIIQARRGYFDPPPDTPEAGLGPALDRAMRTTTTANAVPAAVTAKPEPGGIGIDVQFDIARLPLQNHDGRRDQSLMVIAGLFSSDGQFVTGKRGTLDLALTSSGYKHFRSQGLGATLRLKAAPGVYRLRVAIGEATDGKITALSRQVVIH